MSEINIEQLQDKLKNSRAKYESRKAKLKQQGINITVAELDANRELAQLRNEYITLENELWKYQLENQNKANNKTKKVVEKIVKEVDKVHNSEVKYSEVNESEQIYVVEQQIINEDFKIESEQIYIVELQNINEDFKIEFENISNKLWESLLRKFLINIGIPVIHGVINSSKEGRIGAVALGGAATLASLANDGNIDSL